MRKQLLIISIVLVAVHLSAAKVYFINSPKWTTVKAYMWDNGASMSWPGKAMTKETGMTCSKGDVYSIDAGTYRKIIFNCGSNSCQTADLTLVASSPYWYNEMPFASIEEIEQYTPPVGGVGVPAECEGVMLQAFYWDSQKDMGYGNTKWTTLTAQAEEIGTYFDFVWLPPSAYSTGGLGYHPYQYSNQNSSLGTSTELLKLINALHANGAKVIADIVINHCYSKSTWCDFYAMDFGRFGKFQPTSKWITANDEVNTTPSAGACYQCSAQTAHTDDGDNWDGARDWDHQNEDVQAMCKAYLQWMLDKGYDGFRYDVALGYARKHFSDYNLAAKPYISVLECFDGNKNTLKNAIEQAQRNTMVFDFNAMYSVFRDGIYSKNYSKLKQEGMRSIGYSKYAVTFIDNHDTFNRGAGNNTDVAGKSDGSSIKDRPLIMRCNAFLLTMPGIPCVFYPHWVTYKDEIKKIINARKAAGVHSESKVNDEAGSGYYKATIYGKYGDIILYLGTAAASEPVPQGYKIAVKSETYAVYYTGDGPVGLEDIPQATAVHTRKMLYNGQLRIEANGHYYDIFGRQIK